MQLLRTCFALAMLAFGSAVAAVDLITFEDVPSRPGTETSIGSAGEYAFGGSVIWVMDFDSYYPEESDPPSSGHMAGILRTGLTLNRIDHTPFDLFSAYFGLTHSDSWTDIELIGTRADGSTLRMNVVPGNPANLVEIGWTELRSVTFNANKEKGYLTIDDISLAKTVPEPTTIGLLALGVAVLGCRAAMIRRGSRLFRSPGRVLSVS